MWKNILAIIGYQQIVYIKIKNYIFESYICLGTNQWSNITSTYMDY